MALTFYNYGRDSKCVFLFLQESGQIPKTPLSLDTSKHSRYITLHHAVHAKVKTLPSPSRPRESSVLPFWAERGTFHRFTLTTTSLFDGVSSELCVSWRCLCVCLWFGRFLCVFLFCFFCLVLFLGYPLCDVGPLGVQ